MRAALAGLLVVLVTSCGQKKDPHGEARENVVNEMPQREPSLTDEAKVKATTERVQSAHEHQKAERDRLAAEGEALDKDYSAALEAYKTATGAEKSTLDEKLKDLQGRRQANTAAKLKAMGGPRLKVCPPGQPIC